MLADGDLQDEQDYECDEEDNELQELAEMPAVNVFHDDMPPGEDFRILSIIRAAQVSVMSKVTRPRKM